MLEEALKVVEAARKLGLARTGVSTHSTLDKVSLAFAIDGLRQAIEDFDRETGASEGGPAAAHRPKFATPPQMNERAFVRRMHAAEDMAAIQAHETQEADPEGVASPEPPLDRPSARPAPSAAPYAAALSLSGVTAATAADLMSNYDLGDMEFNDGAESVSDFLEALDMIEDKLEFVVAKIGWTPRLRGLAEAANIARQKMHFDITADGCFIRVPAETWASLSVAVADAVAGMGRDFHIPMPDVRPRPRHDDAPAFGYPG